MCKSGPERVYEATHPKKTGRKVLRAVIMVLDKAIDVATTIAAVIGFGCLVGAGFGFGMMSILKWI